MSVIPTKAGDRKDFLVQTDYFADVYPLVFEAKCKWTSKAEDGLLFSGFEITSVSEGALEELRKLTSLLTISE